MTISNNGSDDIDLTGWYLVSEKGQQTFSFQHHHLHDFHHHGHVDHGGFSDFSHGGSGSCDSGGCDGGGGGCD